MWPKSSDQMERWQREREADLRTESRNGVHTTYQRATPAQAGYFEQMFPGTPRPAPDQEGANRPQGTL